MLLDSECCNSVKFGEYRTKKMAILVNLAGMERMVAWKITTIAEAM